MKEEIIRSASREKKDIESIKSVKNIARRIILSRAFYVLPIYLFLYGELRLPNERRGSINEKAIFEMMDISLYFMLITVLGNFVSKTMYI